MRGAVEMSRSFRFGTRWPGMEEGRDRWAAGDAHCAGAAVSATYITVRSTTGTCAGIAEGGTHHAAVVSEVRAGCQVRRLKVCEVMKGQG